METSAQSFAAELAYDDAGLQLGGKHRFCFTQVVRLL
jgi:hypothetical protein